MQPRLVAVDIGPTGEWGYPADDNGRDRWPSYHTGIWAEAGIAETDLYLVDGRFRVACFAQTVLRSRPDALICIHDFASRPHFHVVRDIADEIASAEDMSVFRPRPASAARASAILDAYRYVPD